jgi:ATP-dependent helicase HrpB
VTAPSSRDSKTSTLIQLPLDAAWPEIEAALREHQNLVIVAEPGAGKTTRFPPRLFHSGLVPADKKILMLEPRRLAARASAHRIAVEQNWSLGGNEVGYQVRFDNRTSANTRLQVLTEGLLARRLQTDPELSDVGCVILDEFHERSQHTDLALGLLFEMQQLARPDLRIVVMSATLDATRVSEYLNDAPVVKVPGRTYPVDLHHGRKPLALDTGPQFLDGLAEHLRSLIDGSSPRAGDILVFLPGAREIRGARERVAPFAERAGYVCLELHGSLSLDEQDRAIRRDPEGRTKIIFSTNIAETSLTIDGVGTVVDTGLARVVRIDAAGFERLQLSRISLASATQRAGRAGRQAAGHCYRLWSKLDENSMPDFEVPELLRTDLSEAVLALLSQGVTEPENFSWFEKPPITAIRAAVTSLTDLGFRDAKSGALSVEGREALKLPLPARLARLVLEAARVGQFQLGAKLAALLSEKDIITRSADLKRTAAIESDVLVRLHLLESGRGGGVDPNAARAVLRVSEAIEANAKRLKLPPARTRLQGITGDELALRLLLIAYPDRVCRRRRAKEPAARMVGVRGVTLAPFSTVETAEFFIAIDSSEPPPHIARALNTSDAQISVASRIERAWLSEQFPSAMTKRTSIVFDETTRTVQKQWAESFHDLPLEDAHPSRPTADEASAVLINAARTHWAQAFETHEELGRVLARLRFLTLALPDDDATKFDFVASQTTFLDEVCFGETRFGDVLAKPLGEAFTRALPAVTTRLLEEAAPDTWTAPTGNRMKLQYPEARDPFIEIRIQEVFGLARSPQLAKGKVKVVMHLLGPNFRPVQVTSDLESFWRSGYIEVRKELRSRYPKHSWPDDPLTAPPVARGRRRT